MHWVRLVHFHVNEARALKAKTFAYCRVKAVKIEPPLESKQQRNNSYKKRPYKNRTCTVYGRDSF